jgi:hypothetical protein
MASARSGTTRSRRDSGVRLSPITYSRLPFLTTRSASPGLGALGELPKRSLGKDPPAGSHRLVRVWILSAYCLGHDSCHGQDSPGHEIFQKAPNPVPFNKINKLGGANGTSNRANKLILSFVSNGEQRIWRSMSRMKLQLMRDRVRLRSRTSVVGRNADQAVDCRQQSTGASGLPILHALANRETDPRKLAQLGGERLQWSEEHLVDALTGRAHVVVYCSTRRIETFPPEDLEFRAA